MKAAGERQDLKNKQAELQRMGKFITLLEMQSLANALWEKMSKTVQTSKDPNKKELFQFQGLVSTSSTPKLNFLGRFVGTWDGNKPAGTKKRASLRDSRGPFGSERQSKNGGLPPFGRERAWVRTHLTFGRRRQALMATQPSILS